MEAKIYGTSKCGWCDRVAKMLEDREVNVEKIDVPFEQSFFGVIANHFSDFCVNSQTTSGPKCSSVSDTLLSTVLRKPDSCILGK